MPIIFDLMDIALSPSDEKKRGSRMGRPNYARELRERLAAAACEPGVSVAKLARENGINANLLFTWRRRYLVEQQAQSAGLIPVVLVSENTDVLRVGEEIAPLTPHRPGRAQLRHPRLHHADSLTVWRGYRQSEAAVTGIT